MEMSFAILQFWLNDLANVAHSIIKDSIKEKFNFYRLQITIENLPTHLQ